MLSWMSPMPWLIFATADRRSVASRSAVRTALSASPFYRPIPFVSYDIAKANTILDDAGWVRGPGGIRATNGVKINLEFAAVAGSPDADSRIELIRSNWAQIGVGIDLKHYN